MSSSNSSLHPWAAIALTLGGQVPTSGVGFYPGSIQGGGWKAAPATQGLVVDPDFACPSAPIYLFFDAALNLIQ